MKSLGSFLKYARKVGGLTQEQVAEKLNIVTPVLSKWENDKAAPSLDVLCRLCNILNVSLEECIAAEIYSGERTLPQENYEAFKTGEILKELRVKNGWSQSEVGKKLYVTSQTVSKWEAGGVTSLQVLGKLAELFGVTPTQLINGLERGTVKPLQITAEQLKKPNGLIIKITAVVLAVLIFFGAIAGLIVGLVLKYRTPAEEQTPPNVTDTEPKKPQIDLCCPVKSFYNAEQSGYNAALKQYGFSTLNVEVTDGAEVYAVADGVVKSYNEGFITIEHSNGFISYYFSDFDIQDIEEGSRVKKGQLIATCYKILSFGLSSGGTRVLPLDYMAELPESVPRPPEHVHEWGELKFDKYRHWRECECGENNEKADHTFEDDKCTVCGYEIPTLPEDIDKTAFCLPIQSQIYRIYNQLYMNGDEPETHKGVDFSAEAGDKIYAVADGVIERINIHSSKNYGVIRIKHSNGIISGYLGVMPADNLKEGASVKKGQLIATVSEEPYAVEEDDGPHLHFIMTYNGVSVNPLEFIPYEETEN